MVQFAARHTIGENNSTDARNRQTCLERSSMRADDVRRWVISSTTLIVPRIISSSDDLRTVVAFPVALRSLGP